MLKDYLISKGLSNREAEVAELVAQGLPNKEVAEKLFVTEKTVKFHLTNIYKKMNVKSRAQLIVWCLPGMTMLEDHQIQNPVHQRQAVGGYPHAAPAPHYMPPQQHMPMNHQNMPPNYHPQQRQDNIHPIHPSAPVNQTPTLFSGQQNSFPGGGPAPTQQQGPTGQGTTQTTGTTGPTAQETTTGPTTPGISNGNTGYNSGN